MTKNLSLTRTPQQLVTEFHQTFGHPVRTTPTLDIPEKAMRITLTTEEATEYADANKADDFVEMVDALADETYVAMGAALAHGIADEVQHRVTTWLANPTSSLRDDTACIPAPLHPTINAVNQDMRNLIAQTLLTLAHHHGKVANQSIEKLTNTLTKLICVCYEASHTFGVDLDTVLEEVQRSNMSKLGADGKPIYRETDGKILKGPNFTNPDIPTVLKKQGWGN